MSNHATITRPERLDQLRGRCHEMTSGDAMALFSIAHSTALQDARLLGEQYARKQAEPTDPDHVPPAADLLVRRAWRRDQLRGLRA